MNNRITSRIKNCWRVLIGDPKEFPLESLVFHSFSWMVFAALILETVVNLMIGLRVSVVIISGIFFIQFTAYLLSRIRRRLNLAIVISCIEIDLLLAVNYIFNSGIAGASLLMFTVSLFTVLSVARKNQWMIWFLINLLLVLTLLTIEYFHPNLIQRYYLSRLELFLDRGSAYLVVATMLFVGTSLIRRNYNRQKRLVDEKAIALEKLNDEKNKLFSIISHDLRSPFASVQQYLEMITQVEISPEERVTIEKDLLARIKDTQGLLSNLLNWSKSQMEGEKVRLQKVAVNELFQRMSNIFEPIAAQKEITLQAFPEEIVITADLDMMRLILRNLVNNAVKFTPSGGKIEVRSIIEKDRCIISVKDNGTGIPLNKQSDIFSLKIQSTSGTKNEKGTGLGLNLCAHYAKLQGGKIWFTSEEKKGSTFYLSLPIA